MKRKDLSYELLLENLSRIQAEKAVLQRQNNDLLERLSSMEESYKAELAAMRQQNASLAQSIETMRMTTIEQQIRINAHCLSNLQMPCHRADSIKASVLHLQPNSVTF